jgi:X-X-X-Leu-X-X-Gly heptad repeat protein
VKERVIEAKVVYYGAGLSGKTTNLEKVKERATEGQAGEMMTLETDGDRTLFFDWLPFNIGKFNGCDVKMQLYTVPGQAKYSETRRRVLSSADGVVLVLDSQAAALPKNLECVRDLLEHLKANGLAADIPIVVQLNKRDLPTAMPPAVLLAETGLTGKPFVEASASTGAGVFETLREVTRVVLERVRSQAKSKASDLKTGDKSGLDGNTLYGQLTGEGAPPKPAAATPEVAAPAAAPAKRPASAPAVPAPAAAPAPPVSSARVVATKPASAVQVETSGALSAGPSSAGPVSAAPLSATPAQISELIAAHRTLSRRLDQIETNVAKSVERGLAELERRVLGRLGEVVDGTKKLQERAEADGKAALEGAGELRTGVGELRTGVGELRTGLTDLERKLKEDSVLRAESTRRVIETATRPIVANTTEAATKSAEGIASVETAIRATSAVLQEMAQRMQELSQRTFERHGQVDTAILGLSERSNVVESRLREMTELYAEMMSDAKKSKTWWR